MQKMPKIQNAIWVRKRQSVKKTNQLRGQEIFSEEAGKVLKHGHMEI